MSYGHVTTDAVDLPPDSLTNLGLPSFATVMANAAVSYLRLWNGCNQWSRSVIKSEGVTVSHSTIPVPHSL